jgi:hypothetical protein
MVGGMDNPAAKLLAHFDDSRRAVADHFGVTPEAVRLWLEHGIPAERALEVEEATRSRVKALDVLKYARHQREAA